MNKRENKTLNYFSSPYVYSTDALCRESSRFQVEMRMMCRRCRKCFDFLQIRRQPVVAECIDEPRGGFGDLSKLFVCVCLWMVGFFLCVIRAERSNSFLIILQRDSSCKKDIRCIAMRCVVCFYPNQLAVCQYRQAKFMAKGKIAK